MRLFTPLATSGSGHGSKGRKKRWQDDLTTLREKLVKIGARIVRHGRYVVFQLAEVAVPRALFVEILRRIDRLRPEPLPA